MQADFRSDTFTRPTAAMLDYMFQAETGDDVFGEDPTVNALEAKAAVMFGKEAALYCPTGTMSNQIAIKVHTQPGDEVICEKNAHVYIYEGGGIALNSGAQVRTVDGDAGRIKAADVRAAINPDDIHKAPTTLVCLENTSNRGGGTCYDWADILAIRKVCTENNLALHLDGARLFNALVKTGQTPAMYGQEFDSISVCLNKGLGCPIGSILLGSATFIRKARRFRKVFGGGMRQAGYMAAAGIYALENNIGRLSIDHNHAAMLADAWAGKSLVKEISPIETNILIIEIVPTVSPIDIADRLATHGIKCIAISPTQIRMVTHLDVSAAMIDYTCQVIRNL